jgi:hypothetical protein
MNLLVYMADCKKNARIEYESGLDSWDTIVK